MVFKRISRSPWATVPMVFLFLSVIQEKRYEMAEEEVKEVFFDKWCPTCKHIDKSES